MELSLEIIDLIEELKNIHAAADTEVMSYLSTIAMALSDKINNVTTTVLQGHGITIKI